MVAVGFKEGPDNFRFVDLINPAKMIEFFMISLAMKIFTILFVLILLGFSSFIYLVAQIFPKALQYTTLSTITIIGVWFVFFYINYIQALIVGLKEYRFWKYLVLLIIVSLALALIPHYTWYAELFIKILGFGLGIMILYPNRASLKDIIFGYLAIFFMTKLILFILNLLIGAMTQIEPIMKFAKIP